jgi:Domain of unknown function (DUF4259)
MTPRSTRRVGPRRFTGRLPGRRTDAYSREHGVWDVGPLDNDDALDFLGDLEDAGDAAAGLRDALRLPDRYVEVPDGSVAATAATVIAIARRGRVSGVAPELAERISALGLSDQDAAALAPTALAALDRLVGKESELVELYDEAEETEAWRATLEPVRAALSE